MRQSRSEFCAGNALAAQAITNIAQAMHAARQPTASDWRGVLARRDAARAARRAARAAAPVAMRVLARVLSTLLGY